MCEDMDAPPPSKRLRISELNPHLLCALCGGYLIDATTIIECLHSFCKTCIVRYLETSKYCPICEVLIHKTRPWQNIRLDHALQNAVYKMVPGLFQSEMKRRREFYEKSNSDGKHPGKGTQPQGMLGSRVIFSQDEEFSISIEFSPNGQPLPESGTKSLKQRANNNCHQDKRYLKCPAALQVSHLKKFIRSKFALPSHILIDLFHSHEPLSDTFSLMDVAYISLWKRDCVLRLFYSFYQKPVKREPEETITKTVAEKVKEKHEVKGRERERAEKEKEDKNKAAAKREKDKSKDVKQGKISGKKEVPSSGYAEATPNVFKAEASTTKQGTPPKRKPNSSELHGVSSPSPDKKQKKTSPASIISTSNPGLVSPTKAIVVQTSVSCSNSYPRTVEVQSHKESHCQPTSSCQKSTCQPTKPVSQVSNANLPPLALTHNNMMNVHASHDKTHSSSSQKTKNPPTSTASDICQDSAGSAKTSLNQGVQTKDEQLTPSNHIMMPSTATISPHDRPIVKTLPQKMTESLNVSSVSVSKSTTPITSPSPNVAKTIPQTCLATNTVTPSSFLNKATCNFTANFIAASSNPPISSPVQKSNGQSSFVTVQTANVRFQNSLPDNAVIKSKPQSSIVHINNVKVSRQCSPVPIQKNRPKCTVSGKTLPMGQSAQSTRVGFQSSAQGIVKGATINQNLAMSVTNKKSHSPSFPTSSLSNANPFGLNPPTANVASKSTSCTLTVISAPVKPSLNPTPVATQTKVNSSSNYPSPSVASPKNSALARRKPAQQAASIESSSSSNGQQTPSPREEDPSATCDDDVVMAEDERFSPSQSNVFERIDRLAKMADSDGRPKDDSGIDGVKEDMEQDDHPEQSPHDKCQSSPRRKSPSCDDVQVISIEYLDSPKQSGDQSRCDDSVQSLKSDDSGVATTMEMEDDPMELSQKGHSPTPTTSPSPGIAQPSATGGSMCIQSKSNSDSEKSRGTSTPVSNGSCSGTAEDSSMKACSHVISNPTNATCLVKCSKPASVLINSSSQTTETGCMTVESSVMFPSRAISTSEPRTMLKIPKDYAQATDNLSKSNTTNDLPSPESDGKLTLCLPVSHLKQPLITKPSSPAQCDQSSSPVISYESVANKKAQTGTNDSSVENCFHSKHLQSTPSSATDTTTTAPCFTSSIQTEAMDLGTSKRVTSVSSSICGPFMQSQPSCQSQVKSSSNLSSGPSNHKLPKEITSSQIKTTKPTQEAVVQKLTNSNDSMKTTTPSRRNSVLESQPDTRIKNTSLDMGKNLVSSTKSTQPLKLTVTLSNPDTPIKVSPSLKESKKSDPPESKRSDNQISSTTSKGITHSTKSHSVARIIATSPSSPSPPPASSSKINNNVIQTTKISTLIPKSSSISSKSSSFTKQFAYPSNINTVPSSRSFLPGAIPHLSRADMMGLLNGTVTFSQNSIDKNSVLSSYSSPAPSSSSSSSSLMSTNSSHHHHHQHHHKSSSKHKDGGSGRLDKTSKAKTIPPLSIPKSCLISPPLKLQRSPGSTDHYIFTHQNPYLSSTAPSHPNGERQRSKEVKNNGNRMQTSPTSSTKDRTGERQRVPSIKISDINRNPIIVESGHNLNNNNNTNHHHRSHSHGSSRSETGSGRRRSTNTSTHSPDSAGPSSSSASSSSSSSLSASSSSASFSTAVSSSLPSAPRAAITKEHRRPSDPQILLGNPWHMHSAAAEFLFHHSFKIPATKFPNLHYDTDAMPLDYSQSSSKL